ncbi:hypothetical protein [Georgenia sp.]
MHDRALLFSLALTKTLATAPLLELVKGKPHEATDEDRRDSTRAAVGER